MNKTALVRGIQMVRADASAMPEIKATLETMNKAFEDFKAEHTQQLADVKKGNEDALQALKVDRINTEIGELQASIDDFNVKFAAAQMGGSTTDQVKDREYSDAFNAHFKSGDVSAALNKGVATEGGYLTPVEWDRTITDKLLVVSDMRQLAQVQTIGSAGFKKLYNMHGTASGWVGEASARPQTATAMLQELAFLPGEIYANPAATQQILDDAEINLEAWLATEVEAEFAKQENSAFWAGDGVNKPHGLLTYITGGANATRHPFGAIAALNSGAAAEITSDSLLDLIYALPAAYAGGARFAMNRATLGSVRKLKDGQGNYLWQPSYAAGQLSTVAGYGVQEVAELPNVAAAATPVVFGDFNRGYLIVDRTGVRVMRDPYTNKPYVHFYTTKRVGGGVQNPDALKALKISV